jgi:hypothetical protein
MLGSVTRDCRFEQKPSSPLAAEFRVVWLESQEYYCVQAEGDSRLRLTHRGILEQLEDFLNRFEVVHSTEANFECRWGCLQTRSTDTSA